MFNTRRKKWIMTEQMGRSCRRSRTQVRKRNVLPRGQLEGQQLLLRSKTLHTDPRLRQELEIFPVSTSDCELSTTAHAERKLACGQGMNLFNQCRIHQHRSMNSHKPVQVELFLRGRDRLSQHVRT